MADFRQDFVTKRWVIIPSEDRQKRLEDIKQNDTRKPREKDCPFCTGNEKLTAKEVYRITDNNESVALEVKIDKDLALEGEMREIVRFIQEGRKKAGFNIEDRIELGYKGREEVFNRFGYEISKEVLADKIYNKKLTKSEYSFEKKVNKEKIQISLRRVKKEKK